MALHAENMLEVKSQGESVEVNKWYHVRVSKVEERTSGTGNATVLLLLKVQDEPFVGRTIPVICSLQPQALFSLKAFYEACEYTPGAEGHDPEQLLDRECFVKATEKIVDGEPRIDIKSYNIKPLRDGRPQK